jgi:hypothetical protein
MGSRVNSAGRLVSGSGLQMTARLSNAVRTLEYRRRKSEKPSLSAAERGIVSRVVALP